MRTLEEIDFQILKDANTMGGNHVPWHDPACNCDFTNSLVLLGKKYREMYSILVDVNKFLTVDRDRDSYDKECAGKDLKDRLRKRLADL